MEQIVINIITAILIAAISAWITVKLSLKQFRTERWWERKVEAYSKIIEALHNSKVLYNAYLDTEKCKKFVETLHQELKKVVEVLSDIPLIVETEDGNWKKELETRAHAASEEILKAMDVGGFLLSEKVLNSLKKYQEATINRTPWHDYLEKKLTAIEECLKDVIKLAKEDLGITP